MTAIIPFPPLGTADTIPAEALLQALADARAAQAERLVTVQLGTILAQGALVGDPADGEAATVDIGGRTVTGRRV
ncbi:MAG: hypothetical protein KA745_00080 [Gemmatimonadales bacterium]|nr:hypothetical protein [Gemmatimonadales bacterium]